MLGLGTRSFSVLKQVRSRKSYSLGSRSTVQARGSLKQSNSLAVAFTAALQLHFFQFERKLHSRYV